MEQVVFWVSVEVRWSVHIHLGMLASSALHSELQRVCT